MRLALRGRGTKFLSHADDSRVVFAAGLVSRVRSTRQGGVALQVQVRPLYVCCRTFAERERTDPRDRMEEVRAIHLCFIADAEIGFPSSKAPGRDMVVNPASRISFG
jgi:hypothetical protein